MAGTERGKLSRADIIKRTKEVAKAEKEKWEKVLATEDCDFTVRIVLGVHKQKLIKHLL